MRFLLLLPWCFLQSLAVPCEWKMPAELVPPARECTQIIEWKYRNEKQATATCLEYFPTTFVEGKRGQDDSHIECTVSQQFECKHVSGSQSIFDKCYTFATTDETTMMDYVDGIKRQGFCGGDIGGIPVFFTMTQAKHIAKAAHRANIFKMWVNVDKDGRTIEKSGTFNKGDLLYKEQWKVNKDYYWDDDKLMKLPRNVTSGEPDLTKPEVPKYLFFRTRTDYVHNMLQGSFERATEKTKATIVCEYPAKIVPDQKKYCGKMKELTINAMYDESKGRKRCVYTSLTTYSLDGTEAAIKAFPGCREKPYTEQVAGIDDGTARKEVYDKLTSTGTYRVSAIKVDAKGDASCYGDCKVLGHCDGSTSDRLQFRHPFAIYNHFQTKDFSREMTSGWSSAYPKDECSDFPTPSMDSKTLAINKKEIIDVPVPVRFPAICSIEIDYCGSKKATGTPMCKSHEVCKNVDTWNKDYGYAECVCVENHSPEGTCNWDGGANACGKIRKVDANGNPLNVWKEVPKTGMKDHDEMGGEDWANHIDRVIVRRGCKMTIWSHPLAQEHNLRLHDNIEYGDYVVPNHLTGTLNGWPWHMSASAFVCSCN